MKFISLDIETTGLDPLVNQTIEVAVIVENSRNQLPFDSIPKFEFMVMHRQYTWQPGAYRINQKLFEELLQRQECLEKGYQGIWKAPKWDDHSIDTLRMVKEYGVVPVHLVARALEAFLLQNGYKPSDKATVAGKNVASFDMRFLRELAKGYSPFGAVYPIHRVLDPSMCFLDWDNDEQPPDTATCKHRAGIAGEQTHRAIFDAWDVIQLLRQNYPTPAGAHVEAEVATA